MVQVLVISAFDSDLDTLGGRLAVQVALAVSLAGVAFLFADPGRLIDPAKLGLRRSLIPPLKPAALAYVVYIGAAILIAIAIQPEQEDVTEQLGYGESAAADVAVGLLVIATPRLPRSSSSGASCSLGSGAGSRSGPPPRSASGIWGLFHFTGPETWGVVLQLAAFGVILSWLYERTGSLWPPIAVHAINNALAFAILTS